MKLTTIFEDIIDTAAYNKWKRDNVTYRGISDAQGSRSSILGKGLYTAPSSNKQFAKTYGKLNYVVNAIPKKPKVFDDLNRWEIFLFNLKCEVLGIDIKNLDYPPDVREFDKKTSIEDEMMARGFDGVIIKGREMVNYKPTDVKMFETEDQLKSYYQSVVDK